MAHIAWTGDWTTNLQDIDEQHQQLISQFNELARLREENDPMQIMQALFDFIASAMNHFAYEEEMLKEASYSLVDTRHNTHQNFTDRLISYQDKIFADVTVLDELLPQIEVWLQRHIGLNDKAYVNHVLNSGIYQVNKAGNLVRPSMEQKVEGAFQEDLPPPSEETTPAATAHIQTEKPKAAEEKEDDDAPRGWATGAY